MVRTHELRPDLRVLLYRDEAWWSAHCLEMDLPAVGKTPRQALSQRSDLCDLPIRTALEEGDLASIYSLEPPQLWQMYATAEDFEPARRPTKPVDRFTVREPSPV